MMYNIFCIHIIESITFSAINSGGGFLDIKILGARGSVPVDGSKYNEFGGASTCILIRMLDQVVVFDAGTGILKLNDFLTEDEKHVKLFLSHAHADHLIGLAMCPNAFDKDFSFEVYGCKHNGISTKQQIEALYEPPTWPVSIDELPADFTFTDLRENSEIVIDGIIVKTLRGIHPNGVTLYRLESGRESVVFATDCSITEGFKDEFIDFAQGCDYLFVDGQYSDTEAITNRGFGHNPWNESAELGLLCNAKNTIIIHHSSYRTDPELRIAEMEAKAVNPNVFFAREDKYGLTDELKAKRFIDLCLALSAERDREKLLSMILDSAMEISACDAGTLYLAEDDGLHFCRMVTLSKNIRQGGHDAPISLPPVPLDPSYASAWAALNNKSVNVPDIHGDTDFNFYGSYKYDEMTGYKTKSVLMVPMSNEKEEIIGVMQLINAKDSFGRTIPFDASIEQLINAIASQAAISITNMQYSDQIMQLLDSLVGTLSTAIDERSPYNANHTKNMVRYATNFINWLDKTNSPYRFDENKRRAFLMSVWLHDVGKLVVPLEVMNKPDRLGPLYERLKNRLHEKTLLAKIDLLEGRIEKPQYEKIIGKCDDILALVDKINGAGFMQDDMIAMVKDLHSTGWLTDEEFENLSIKKGTLTEEERAIMESHVVVTRKILDNVAFPKIYARVPEWAAGHHEMLNGKGYPNQLTADQISREVRLLTILDVFDALTAVDRPYKPAMPVDKALSILHIMAEKEGSIDLELLKRFEESKAWEQ